MRPGRDETSPGELLKQRAAFDRVLAHDCPQVFKCGGVVLIVLEVEEARLTRFQHGARRRRNPCRGDEPLGDDRGGHPQEKRGGDGEEDRAPGSRTYACGLWRERRAQSGVCRSPGLADGLDVVLSLWAQSDQFGEEIRVKVTETDEAVDGLLEELSRRVARYPVGDLDIFGAQPAIPLVGSKQGREERRKLSLMRLHPQGLS